MAEKFEIRSLEDAAQAVEDALARLAPRGASMWSAVQLCRKSIDEKRSSGASWAEIAAAIREAGYPNANETNVRLAHQAEAPSEKVNKARRRRSQKQKSEATAPPPALPPLTESPEPIGSGPRLLKDRYN